MTSMELSLQRIAHELEKINENGIVARIKFPDVDDKFVADLPAMRIANYISEAISHLTDTIYETFTKDDEEEQETVKQKEITLQSSIEDMDLSVRAINCLKRSGHNTIQDVLNAYYDESLIEVRNLGRKCYDEVVKKLIELGFVDHV